MGKIKNIIFDFGGVVVTLDHPEAIRRFTKLGIKDAAQQLDPCVQSGVFGKIEKGEIGEEEFRKEISILCGRDVSWDECQWAWMGYMKHVPAYKLELLRSLRSQGYRLIMLSNTNPFIAKWAMTKDFSKHIDIECLEGAPASDYFDAVYMSFDVKAMKPDAAFFTFVMEKENLKPEETVFIDDGLRNVEAAAKLGIHTINPKNGEDWSESLNKCLEMQ